MSERTDQHVIVEDETLAQGFTQIPNGILRRSDIPPGAKLTYMVLLSYAWQKDHAYPGQDRLALDMGVSERSVITYLKQLSDAGLISIKRRGLGKTNLYIIHRISGSANSADQGRGEKSALLDVKNQTAPEVQDLPGKNTQGKDTREADRSNVREIDPEKQDISNVMRDFARELGDTAPLPSTVTRAYNLYKRSGVELDPFLDVLYEARRITQERSGSIRTKADRPLGPKPKVGYFFSVVSDLLGLGSELGSHTRETPTESRENVRRSPRE